MNELQNKLQNVSRRRFLKQSAVAAGGLVVAFTFTGGMRFAVAQPAAGPAKLPSANAFLRIGADGFITVVMARSEMGQGVWTSVTMLLAEELDADWSKIRIENAPIAPDYINKVFHMQGTGGSTSTVSEFDRYRQVGAMARGLLLQAAAQRFKVPVATLRTENGAVLFNDQRVPYGELADAAGKLPPLSSVELKKPEQWTLIGKPTKRLDTPEKITGRAQFGMDVRFPGLMTAVIARVPVFGGTLKSFDASKAKAVPGVRTVVQVPSGVAVVAENFWAATQGREALQVEWDLGPHAALDSEALRQRFRQLIDDGKGAATALKTGDVQAALGKAAQTVEAEYFVPYMAHAPMEPLNCAVKLSADQCEIWTGTQTQSGDQATAAQITGLKPEQVILHTMFLGGGFGRRGTLDSDFVKEAVHVAKAAGLPVKTVWTREDDIRGGYYRPMFLHRMRVGLDANGMPLAWRHTAVGQSVTEGTAMASLAIKNGIDQFSVEGAVDAPYLVDMPDALIDLHSPQTGIAAHFWRSVGHSHTGFVMEGMIDELAHAAGQDPLAYRRKLLAKHPRDLGVLNLAAEKAGWGTPLPAGRARGIAVHASFGSFAAHVVEVSVEQGQIRVHRVVCAIDCGVAVNPAGLQAQLESAVVFGLTAALHARITLKDGRVQQSNFHDYRMLRINEMPLVEAHIVPSTEKVGGAGEPGMPPVAPAVANAVFALTGQRLRELPLRLDA